MLSGCDNRTVELMYYNLGGHSMNELIGVCVSGVSLTWPVSLPILLLIGKFVLWFHVCWFHSQI